VTGRSAAHQADDRTRRVEPTGIEPPRLDLTHGSAGPTQRGEQRLWMDGREEHDVTPGAAEWLDRPIDDRDVVKVLAYIDAVKVRVRALQHLERQHGVAASVVGWAMVERSASGVSRHKKVSRRRLRDI
jgi:hypothetical protein